jgi:putative transposase
MGGGSASPFGLGDAGPILANRIRHAGKRALRCSNPRGLARSFWRGDNGCMPNFRRNDVAGGMYFFTVVTDRRARWLCEPAARDCLRTAFRLCRERWPFSIDVMVLLPDHLHAIWTLPPGDSAYSVRWAFIKRTFTRLWLRAGGEESVVTNGRHRQGRRGVWQPRFWEHTMRDVHDWERHTEYILYNPVKHGLCRCPADWPFSTFHGFVEAGYYPQDWACSQVQRVRSISPTSKPPPASSDRRARFPACRSHPAPIGAGEGVGTLGSVPYITLRFIGRSWWWRWRCCCRGSPPRRSWPGDGNNRACSGSSRNPGRWSCRLRPS